MKYITLLLYLTLFAACLTAPELDRSNQFDADAGIPYVYNFQHSLNSNGITFGWIDGSNDNNAFILIQKMYDNDSSTPDSLIVISELEPDDVLFQDISKNVGYPYTSIIQSVIYDNRSLIRDVRGDTISIDFGILSNGFIRNEGDSLRFSWRNRTVPFYVNNVLVEKRIGSEWVVVDELATNAQLYRFPTSDLTGNDEFRISSTIINFNGNLSRTSSLDFFVD